MKIYHLPIEITPRTNTQGEIERLRALLNDPETQICQVVEVRTSHPAIMAVIEALIAEAEAMIEVFEDATPEPPKAEKPKAAKTIEPRLCEFCSQTFRPRRRDSRFCSKECESKFYRRQAAEKKNGHKPKEQLPESDEEPHQVMPWKLPGGQEVNNVQILLAKGKLAVGAKLHHHKRGFFEVTQGKRGLMLKPIGARS